MKAMHCLLQANWLALDGKVLGSNSLFLQLQWGVIEKTAKTLRCPTILSHEAIV